MSLRFKSSSEVASDRLSKLSVVVMALGIAALLAAGVLFALSATGIIDGGLSYSGPGTVTGFGSVVETPSPSTPSPSLPTPSSAPLAAPDHSEGEVDAPLVTLGVDDNGVMQSTSNAYDVAWYDFSARPGAGGNAVFSGHVDYHDVGAAVFWNLRELERGRCHRGAPGRRHRLPVLGQRATTASPSTKRRSTRSSADRQAKSSP